MGSKFSQSVFLALRGEIDLQDSEGGIKTIEVGNPYLARFQLGSKLSRNSIILCLTPLGTFHLA